MKKVQLLAMVLLVMAACNKDEEEAHDPVKQAAIDDELIQIHFEENNITDATKDPSGLYYRILDDSQASGATVPYYASMTIRYKGMYLDDVVFDTNEDDTNKTPFRLSSTIKGWQIGIPKLRLKEKAMLYIPSGLAYGPGGNPPIAPNTVLKFEVKVLEVSQ
ncbi:FKBP-type peptidyl-prolyl cis-trans isomerase [Carboxylicivirga sp. N1Y90]|uniref:FKBP-type peptidyl-prolyl cis-trans isomerase n=1 Tax=Carboxylicivirga fragile TaxID=3417571 RepID=UPI003D3445ED|nr:FKBP-type peptidyl-prolyl cis-trans isomerase [Marinilabiliaceae bacterium N1Y90]